MIVVFDIGNVLLRWDPRNLYRKVFDDEARMERFLATALGRDFILQTDVEPDFAAAIEERARAFPEFADEVRLYDLAGSRRLAARSRRTSRCLHAFAPPASRSRASATTRPPIRPVRDAARLPAGVRRARRIGPCRRRQARPAHLRDPDRTRRPPAARAAVHRRHARQRARGRSARHGGDPLPPG